MFSETLYKQDSTGKIRTYQAEIDGSRYRMLTGTKEGKKSVSKWTECTSKNVGRANETDPDTQATLEVEARITKKLSQNYYRTEIECVNTPEQFFQVMLATEEGKVKGGVKYPAVLDPKLDGMRLVEGRDIAYSRKGKPIPTSIFITEELEEFFETYPNIILDGEIYSHELKSDFNQLMSVARKQKPNNEDLAAAEQILEYHVYDLYDTDNPTMTALDRKELLTEILPVSSKIHLVDYQVVHNEEELETANGAHIADGYEGSIARDPNGEYINKRSKNLLKIKQFITEEFDIHDILEGTGNRSGIAGSVVIYNEDVRVKCGIRGNWEHAKKLLNDKSLLIGRSATVRHFGVTPDGSLRFPICIDVDRPD